MSEPEPPKPVTIVPTIAPETPKPKPKRKIICRDPSKKPGRPRKDAVPDPPFAVVGEPGIRIPLEWGELPLHAKWADEVEWVHQNRSSCIVERAGKANKIELSFAQWPAPSKGAIGMMQDCSRNPQAFMRDVILKAKNADTEDESERIIEEKKSIQDVRKALAKLLETR